MTTKDEAISALEVLWNQSGDYLLDKYGLANSPEFDADYDKRFEAYRILTNFIVHKEVGLSDQQKVGMTENWINTLAMRFGGLDFWRLSKKWKRITYHQVASMIVNEMDWVMKNNNNPKFNR